MKSQLLTGPRYGWAFAFSVLALQAVVIWFAAPEVLQGRLIDTDSYMRLLRVRELLESGAWFDAFTHRSNWPFGEASHWTRPVDVLLALPAWLLSLLVDAERALFLSAAAFGPLVLVATGLGVVWAVAPITSAGHLAALALLAQPVVFSYSLAGRADHHGVILLVFVLTVGCALRVLERPERARLSVWAGALCGLGIWVSTEFLLPLALLLGGGALEWVLRGRRLTRANLNLSLGYAGSVVAALLVERPYGELFAVEYDRISAVHVAVGIVAVAFWSLVTRFGRAASRDDGPAALRARVAIALIGALAAALAVRLFFPGFFLGPWVDVDPDVTRTWLRHVAELDRVWPSNRYELGRYVQFLGLPLLALPYAAYRAFRGEREGRPPWRFLLTGLAVFLVLGSARLRFCSFAEVVGAMAVGALLQGLWENAGRARHPLAVVGSRVGSVAGVLLGPLLVGFVLMAGTSRAPAMTAVSRCDFPVARQYLERQAEPRTILAHMDRGPEILYETAHRVLATPYHRNRAGILGARAILVESDPDRARELATEREVDWILICPAYDRGFFGAPADGEGPSLFDRLVESAPPEWLRLRADPEALGGLLLYERTDR